MVKSESQKSADPWADDALLPEDLAATGAFRASREANSSSTSTPVDRSSDPFAALSATPSAPAESFPEPVVHAVTPSAGRDASTSLLDLLRNTPPSPVAAPALPDYRYGTPSPVMPAVGSPNPWDTPPPFPPITAVQAERPPQGSGNDSAFTAMLRVLEGETYAPPSTPSRVTPPAVTPFAVPAADMPGFTSRLDQPATPFESAPSWSPAQSPMPAVERVSPASPFAGSGVVQSPNPAVEDDFAALFATGKMTTAAGGPSFQPTPAPITPPVAPPAQAAPPSSASDATFSQMYMQSQWAVPAPSPAYEPPRTAPAMDSDSPVLGGAASYKSSSPASGGFTAAAFDQAPATEGSSSVTEWINILREEPRPAAAPVEPSRPASPSANGPLTDRFDPFDKPRPAPMPAAQPAYDPYGGGESRPQASASAGPSEFTVIRSLSEIRELERRGAKGSAAAPAVAAPAPVQAPAAAAWQPPQMPQPQFGAGFQPPQYAMPAMPQPPVVPALQPPAVPAAPVSKLQQYTPLLLLLIAVLLVVILITLVFLLKH